MESKAKTRKQIAAEYGICVRTLNKWMKNEGLNFPPGLLTPAQQEEIHERLRMPKQNKKNEDQIFENTIFTS
jgi:hypothetical protein